MCVADSVDERRQINDNLYQLVVNRDKQAIEDMITNNQPYVRWRVRRFLNAYPRYEYLHDDLVGAGDCALVEIVAAMGGNAVESPNSTGFIYVGVTNALRDLIGSMASDRVAARHLGYPEKPPKVHSLIEERYTGSAENTLISCFELMDSILACCITPEEIDLVHYRAEGYSNRSISSLLGIPRQTVDCMLETIYARYKKDNDL